VFKHNAKTNRLPALLRIPNTRWLLLLSSSWQAPRWPFGV